MRLIARRHLLRLVSGRGKGHLLRMNSRFHTFCIGLAVASFSSLAAWAHSANEPVPRNEQWWQDRQKLLNQRAAEAGERAQVIFIGDSITQGWEGGGKDVWEQYYAPRHAVNLGISGDRTQHVLWRLEHGNLDGLKPKAAVVMIGTNNSNGEDNTPGQIVDGVTAIVRKLREKLPDTKILLLAIFPRNENYSPQRGKILEVNQVLRKLADNQNIYWVDFGYRFVNNDGLIPADLMPDYLHPDKRGYEIWAASMERRLSSILGDEAVKPLAANTVDVNGQWISTIHRPNGQDIETQLVLKSQDGQLTGKVARGDDGWVEIENGQIKGNELSFVLKRDRSDGSTTTYHVAGKVADGRITGTVKSVADGQERSAEWTARRP
jgi:lysophospholipase L1-like esterase